MTFLLACSQPCMEGYRADGDVCVVEELPRAEVLAPLPLLRRSAIELRGVLPTVEEAQRVLADPSELRVLQRAYLDDPLHEERLVALLGEEWATYVDEPIIPFFLLGLGSEQEQDYETSIAEEPLRLLARIAVEDRPFSDIVRADFTIGNPVLASIWPLELSQDEGWSKATWTDGRPRAGVLASNGFLWRYTSTESNANRGRAEQLTQRLVCHERLGEIGSLVPGGVEDAVREDPACLGCHVSLDPIAASMFGFLSYVPYAGLEAAYYHADREPLGELTLGVEAAWYGRPVAGVEDLGAAIAEDPRFSPCQVQTMASLLWRSEPTWERTSSLAATWDEGGQRMRDLEESLVMAPEFGSVEPRLLTAEALRTVTEDLTGFVWTYLGLEAMRSSDRGVRTLAGGTDNVFVTRPISQPTLGWTLTIQRLAEQSARFAVTTELEEQRAGPLFAWVTLEDRPHDEAFELELESLRTRLHGRVPSEELLELDRALWLDIEAAEGPAEAWSALVSLLLREPDFVSY